MARAVEMTPMSDEHDRRQRDRDWFSEPWDPTTKKAWDLLRAARLAVNGADRSHVIAVADALFASKDEGESTTLNLIATLLDQRAAISVKHMDATPDADVHARTVHSAQALAFYDAAQAVRAVRSAALDASAGRGEEAKPKRSEWLDRVGKAAAEFEADEANAFMPTGKGSR